jgi:1-acyl-sn-glycerol-3-phosphate acyltransferase
MPLVRRYVDFRLRRAFEAVYVAGLDEARGSVARGPVIVAANHVAWWDPLLATAIDARMGCEGYALMDAESLARLWFFGAIGALPLSRSNARDARRDLVDAASRLTGPGRALWIFPQGRQRPSHLRPLGLAGGVAWLAERCGAVTLPLSISYLYRDSPQPAIFATFGPPLRFSARRVYLRELEQAIHDGLDRNDAGGTTGTEGFSPLWPAPSRSSMPLGGRLLARAAMRDGSRKEA